MWARRARALGLSTSLDITLNPPRDTAADVLPLLPFVDLFLPNLAEAQVVLGGGDAATLLSRGLARGVRLMGLKLGEQGCWLAAGDQRVHAPAFPVAALDTVGAGDAWSVAVVYGWRQGWPLAEIGRFANAAGALATLQTGATEGMAGVELLSAASPRNCALALLRLQWVKSHHHCSKGTVDERPTACPAASLRRFDHSLGDQPSARPVHPCARRAGPP